MGGVEVVTRARGRVPRVDHHQHLFGPAVVKLLAPHPPPAISAADLLALLDAAGIGRALVLSVAYLFGSPARTVEDEYAAVRRENDWTLAQAALGRQRLRAFCSFNPLKPYALDELARCASRHHGLKLHLANSDVQLDDPDHVRHLQSVFAGANRFRMPVVVHLRANIRNRRPYGEGEARTFIEEVLPAAPDVAVQIAHLAGTGPGYDDPPADRALDAFVRSIDDGDGRARLWFDVAALATETMSRPEAERMAERIRQVGVDRVLFGSDAASGDNLPPREAWTAFARLPLTDEELAAVAENVAPYGAWRE